MAEKILEDGKPTGAVMQSFAPAAEVIASVYDSEDGRVEDIDGRRIQAILCERRNVIPTLRDFPILKAGIPLALSTDFEAADSRSVTVFFKDGEFHHVYKGAELTEDEQAKLDDAMEVFNLQPHDLGQEEDDAEAEEKVAEVETDEETEEDEEIVDEDIAPVEESEEETSEPSPDD